MATFSKLYLHNQPAPYTPATIRGTWNDTAGAVTKALDQTPNVGGVFTTVARAETNATNPFDVLLYRGVSGPLDAQTISGTVNVIIGILESNASADFNWHVHIYVTQGDTDTPRGTLLTDYTEAAGTNEWPTTATGKALNAAQTLTSLAISAGDRLVVEIGYRARNAVTTSFTGTLNYGCLTGGVAGADLTVGSTSVTTQCGTISFSNAITELIKDIRVTQEVVETLAFPVSNIRVTQEVVEALTISSSIIRVTQEVVEVLATTSTSRSITGSGGIVIGGSGTPSGTHVSPVITGTGGIIIGGSGTPSGINLIAANIQFTQELIEVIATRNSGIQFTQFVIEVPALSPPSPLRFTQEVIETAALRTAEVHFTQLVIEVISHPNFIFVPPDPGGKTPPGTNPPFGNPLCGADMPLAFIAVSESE